MPIAHFAHGVASGDPRPTSVVIWTRVTPTSASKPGSGAGPDVTVRWQVSTTSSFTSHRALGATSRTGPARDHTVKVDVTGLKPDTPTTTASSSAAHRSRSAAPARHRPPTSSPANLRFGVVSCANLQAGWFSAYRHLADRNDLHAVLHLGDYLYEYGPGEYGYGQGDVDIRPHEPAHEILSLADYRQRHAQYKRDPDLQRPAREVPVHRHLGRPRVGQRRLEGRRGEPHPGRGRLVGAARRQPQGVRRVDAGPAQRHGGARRRHPALPPAAVRRPRRAQHARPAHLPDQQLPPRSTRRAADPDPHRSPAAQLDWLKARSIRQAARGSWSATR